MEDDILARGRVLKAGRVANLAGDVRGYRAGRPQQLGCQRGQDHHEEEGAAETAKTAESHPVTSQRCGLCELRSCFFSNTVRFRGSL